MSEWPKEHAWKVCIPQGIEGSNPSLTAIYLYEKALLNRRAFLCLKFGRGENPRRGFEPSEARPRRSLRRQPEGSVPSIHMRCCELGRILPP